jgi:hypothetical protein
MRSSLIVGLLALGAASCATPDKQELAATDAPPRQRCEVLQTGSNLRCNRNDVRVTTREEAERQRQLSTPVRTDSSPVAPRGN